MDRRPYSLLCLAIAVSLLGSGCAFVPKVEPDPLDCSLLTKRLTLELSDEGDRVCRNGGPECLAAMAGTALVLPAASLIVSGSVVLAGNTIHWLERQGSCEGPTLRSAISSLRRSAGSTPAVSAELETPAIPEP